MQALAFGHLNNVLTQLYCLHCEHIFIIWHLEMPPRATLTKINIYREQESEGPGVSRDLSAFPWGYSPWLEGTFCAGKK